MELLLTLLLYVSSFGTTATPVGEIPPASSDEQADMILHVELDDRTVVIPMTYGADIDAELQARGIDPAEVNTCTSQGPHGECLRTRRTCQESHAAWEQCMCEEEPGQHPFCGPVDPD